jgi:hypothetical protein
LHTRIPRITRTASLAETAARCALIPLLAALGSEFAATPSAAQQAAPTRVEIAVTDAEEGTPVAGVRARLLRSGRSGITDEEGAAGIVSPLAGADTLILSRVGYATQRVALNLPHGGTTRVRVALRSTPIPLDEVVAEGRPAPRPTQGVFGGFWERRARGSGYFITRAQIDEHRPTHTSDLLRLVPGLRLIPARHGGFDVRLGRARHISRDPGYRMRALHDNPGVPPNDCPIQLFVNGHPYHNDNMSFDEAFRPEEIEALEIYNSPGQTPAQFAGRWAQCGVIVVWLRRGGD